MFPAMGNWGLWIICAGIPLVFGLWAQSRVKSTFSKYSDVRPRNGMSGAEAAAAVLRSSGLEGLSINPVQGRLTDNYDPRKRTLNLSADVGQTSSIAAMGVAAHEAGHAVPGRKPLLADARPPDAHARRPDRFLTLVLPGDPRLHLRLHRARHHRPRAARR